GGLERYNSYYKLKNMDDLYNKLFIYPFITGEHKYNFMKRRKCYDRSRKNFSKNH
ncbi:Reverse transcriptase (RNA-dependent DNA polymerase), partial [Schaedlerella arabinosiphila]|nr:Reverse transcriptase (RNA-dependent DNA polymerase) [Schaedlerella arabinosiphila]